MARKDSRCIFCGKYTEGLRVREDYIIGTVRFLKRRIFHNEKGYALVVCKEDYPKYVKARGDYQTRQLRLVLLGVVFMVVLVALGSDKLFALLDGLVVVMFTYLISLLGYTPEVELPAGSRTHARRSRRSR